MRYSPAEKLEIIRLVENSSLSIKATLAEVDVPRSTFYRWYLRYQESGPDGLSDRKAGPRQFWNRIPQAVREQVVKAALEQPEKSPRELAWHLTDNEEYFISESSVYRILKSYDLVTSPVFQMITAGDRFETPTRRVNEMWQTDFTQFKVISWGWYYLCTILDDYSRYILSWRLSTNMAAGDVEETLQMALDKVEVTRVKVKHRPRLLSDNGPAFVSQALKEYLRRYRLTHIRGAPYHPMTQGKIERYHRSMKNVVKLQTFYFPWELEQTIKEFVVYYNNERYHESLDNLTPADVYFGRAEEVKTKREQIKQATLEMRRQQHRRGVQDRLYLESESSLILTPELSH
jgi:putative transposase